MTPFTITLECMAYFFFMKIVLKKCPDDVTLNGFFTVEAFSDKTPRLLEVTCGGQWRSLVTLDKMVEIKFSKFPINLRI